ncbi:MAG: tetratricopeptide repeat protein [Candidatus Methylomirabilales bacterium]
MRMVRVFLRTVPIVLLLVGCATTPPAKQTELAATRYDLGVAYFDAGHFRRAVPEFAKAVELSPSDPVYHTALGMALMFTKNLDQAIKEFEAAIQADARFSEAKNNLASAYMLKGDLEKARALLVQVLDDPFYPTPQFAYFNLARIYERQGKVNRAIAEYRRALDITRDYVEAHNNLGFLYLQQSKTDLAIKEFSEATHLSPKVAIYQRNLGAAYYQAGNRGKARKAFEKVVELEPDSPSAEYARKMLEQLK